MPAVEIIRAVEDNRDKASAIHNPSKVLRRKVEFDYLRAFAVTLVLFHHAVIAYITAASINFENPIATFSPVVNEQRCLGFNVIVAFNETFFMPLLFFISGMFVWQSLERKGGRKYLADRLKRLGYPFVAGVLFLIPLAYYPAQLQVGRIVGMDSSYGSFWLEMVRSGFGTAGPLWFLWLLLTFDCLAALLYRVVHLQGSLIGEHLVVIPGSPSGFLGALLGISLVVYLPVAIIFGPLKWIGFGPFNAQVGRILLYLLYFLAGTVVGAYGIDRSVFRSGGALAKRWWGWLAVGLISFSVFIVMLVVVTPEERTIVSEIAFVLCCGATVFGITGLFLRFAKRRTGIFDSLSENSYGIYVVHYVFVTWLQYSLLDNSLAPCVKGTVVFIGTLILSWGTVAALRCIPVIARIL